VNQNGQRLLRGRIARDLRIFRANSKKNLAQRKIRVAFPPTIRRKFASLESSGIRVRPSPRLPGVGAQPATFSKISLPFPAPTSTRKKRKMGANLPEGSEIRPEDNFFLPPPPTRKKEREKTRRQIANDLVASAGAHWLFVFFQPHFSVRFSGSAAQKFPSLRSICFFVCHAFPPSSPHVRSSPFRLGIGTYFRRRRPPFLPLNRN